MGFYMNTQFSANMSAKVIVLEIFILMFLSVPFSLVWKKVDPSTIFIQSLVIVGLFAHVASPLEIGSDLHTHAVQMKQISRDER